MKKLYSLAVAAMAALTFTQNVYAESSVLTPTQTTVIQANGKTATNADVVLYDATATSWTCSQAKISNGVFTNQLANYEGSPIVLTKFDASSTLDGKKLTKATLKFTSVCTEKNSNVQLAKVNTGWNATTATWTNTNTAEILNAVNIDEVTNGVNVKTTPKELTYDVTEYLQANTDNTIGFGIYTYTGRAQKISDISLTLEYIDASAAANVTIKYVDGAGNELKTSNVREMSAGVAIELKDADKASIYNDDKSVKYVYVSDDAADQTVAKDGSTVVTVKFREAEKWNYTFNAVDKDGNVLQEGIVKGTNFEGETFSVGYPYAINVDSVLYTSPKLSSDKKGFYMSFRLDQADKVQNVTFSPSTTTRVAFYAEAENIEGLTKADNANTGIRSSNGASAYAAEEDVEIVKLPAGAYKLTANICDATKNHDSKWNFLAGNDTIFTFTPTAVNWSQGTSEEFTINKTTSIILAKGGSKNAAVDFIYIQKTGDVEAVEPVEPAMTLPEAGTYYIKNVATGKYLSAGSSWGSRSIVDNEGIDVILALADGKYTIDSQISNGGNSHFLGDGLFTDSGSFPWIFALAKTADGKDAITISTGSKYLAAPTGDAIDLQLNDAADDYAKWVFIADTTVYAERLASLNVANAENPVDATMLLKGHAFNRNDLRNKSWNGNPGVGGFADGNSSNTNGEKYNCTYDVYQTLNVPNGKYVVTAQGFYRNGNIKTSAAAHVNETEALLAKFYANSVEKDIPSIYSEAGKVDQGSTADGIEGKFPNSQAEASAFFNAGAYNMVLENVYVFDGTLRLGFSKSEAVSEDWTCFDNVRLTYYGEITDASVFKAQYEKALEDAKAIVADEAYAVVTGEELATLNAVIAASGSVEDTKDAYLEAISALNEAKTAFTDAKPAYQTLVDTKAQYKDFDFSAYKYADSGRAAAVKRSMSATAKTATDATQIAQNIVNGIRGYVESNAVAEGVDGAEPATEIIQNPNAEALEGWTTTNAEGSNGVIRIMNNEPLTDSEGNTAYSYFDSNNWGDNSWDVTYTQTVGLPRGKYLLSVFSRASEGVSTFDLIANVVADENGGIAPLDGEITVEPGDGDNTGDAEAADTVRFKAPMQHIGAQGGIFGRGWNNTTLEFEVTSDYANVDLGIHGATTTEHNWMSFTSFQLTLLEQSVEEVEVENIAALRELVTDPNADYNVKLKLTDAKISKIVKESYGGQEMTSFAVIEDATGALSLGYLLPEAEAEGLISTEGWKDGTTLNGYICGTYNYPSDMFANANTAKSEITATESTFTPTAANLSDVLKAENNYRSYEFKDVKIATVGEGDFVSYALVANETTNVSMIDAFSVLPEEMPTEFATVSGILVGDIQYGSESADFNFYPVAYTLKSTGISSIDQAAKNAAVYTVNGVKVRAAGESVKGLKKGIYVVGGKKIVVK